MDMRFNNILTPPHLKEGYKIMPPMDKDKYPEMPGLEGPFTLMSGKVVYYDPKEGAYYDKDTDMYMSYDEFQQHDNDYSNMKDERDEVKEVDKLAIDNAVAQAMSSAPQTSPRPKARPKRMPRPKARPTINIGSNPETGATRGIDPRDNYSPEDLKRLLMQNEADEQLKELSDEDRKEYYRSIKKSPGYKPIGGREYPEPEIEIPPGIGFGKFPKQKPYKPIGGRYPEPEEIETAKDLLQKARRNSKLMQDDVAVRRDGKTLSKGEKAKLQRQGVLMKEEANESVEDIIKRAMKELKRIDPQVMFRTRDMMKAVATIKQGNIAGALQDLVNGVDGPENQIQDVFNSTHDTLQRLINPKTDKEVDDEYWADVDNMKAKSRIGEGDGRKKGIHGKGHPMRKAQQAAIHANEGKMSDSIIDDSETMSKAEFTKKHGKEMADQYFESRKVSMNQVCEAVKQTDPTYAVAKYVRTTLDPSYKTWDQVHEQVEHILSCINEGNIVDANTVMQILSRTNLQEKADKGMMLKENIDSLRKIVRDKAYQTVKFSDGSMKVDLTTASMFLQVYEKQKPETQAKMDKMLGKKSGFLKLLDVMYSKMSQ